MADTQVETIMLAASTSTQQPPGGDLLQILSNSSTSSTSHPSSSSTSAAPSSSSSLSTPSSSAVASSNNNITSSNTTAVDTTNHPQIQSMLCNKSPEPLLDEPETKRRKTSPAGQTHEKLESRLNGILCCAVCLDLPKNAIYQVRAQRRL